MAAKKPYTLLQSVRRALQAWDRWMCRDDSDDREYDALEGAMTDLAQAFRQGRALGRIPRTESRRLPKLAPMKETR